MVSIIIVTFYGEKFIEKLLDSIDKQTYQDFEVIIIDNNSKDKTLEIIKDKTKELSFSLKLLVLNKNYGYTVAVNKGIREASGEFILVLNQDVYLSDNFLENALKGFFNKKIGFVSGKILRFDGKTIDSTGQFLSLSLYPVERDYNKMDSEYIKREKRIFSVCGAVAFYKKEMLEKIKIDDEYFDEDFFMFFDDIDLGWRANILGWKGVYVDNAVAYHYRSGSLAQKGKIFLTFKRSSFIQYHIIKNRYLTLIKNARISQVILHLPFIITRDIVYLFIIMIKPSIFKQIIKSYPIFKKALLKRRKIWTKVS